MKKKIRMENFVKFFSFLEIWDALHAASEAEFGFAQAIVESAGIIVITEDMSVCYDERGTEK